MWYLTSNNDPRTLYIVSEKEVVIGRSVDMQVCTFAIAEDPSISRKHALLTLFDDGLYLQDLGSRYGTFVNNMEDKIEANTKLKLNLDDQIRFGKMVSVWKLHKCDMVTCTSTLKGEDLQRLREVMNKIGGHLKSDWDNTCSYLTMPAITLTIKVVLALVQCSHIVTTDFWLKCQEAVNNYEPLPDPKNYTPQIMESTLNKEIVSFVPNENRKTIFAGKKFIFFSKRQYDMYKIVLFNSSATPLLLSETKMTKSMISEDNVIVIQYNSTNSGQETQAQKQQINDIINYLKSKGKRVIADAEIGLAILYCSVLKYCNPDFNFTSEVIKQVANKNTESVHVLAQESQESNSDIKSKKESMIVNETLTSNELEKSNSKRKLSDDFHVSASKKLAVNDIETDLNCQGLKRKFTEDETQSNPNKKIDNKAHIDDDDDDDLFNFMSPEATDKNTVVQKKLNLSRPNKRKADVVSDDDDLFNFVHDKPKVPHTTETSENRLFEGDNKGINNRIVINQKKKEPEVDLSAMRGAKLKELMQSDFNWNSDTKCLKIKKESTDELDEKMSNLELGGTIVTVKKELIVKKEPLCIGEQNNQVKNFKKFKKVWPLKMQVTIISKSSLSLTTSGTETNTTINPIEEETS